MPRRGSRFVETSEDWPPAVWAWTAASDARGFYERNTKTTWIFWVIGLGAAGDPRLFRVLDLQPSDRLVGLLMWNETLHPDLLFRVLGFPPPTEGAALLHWDATEGEPPIELMIRHVRAYVRKSAVFAEVWWVPGEGGFHGIMDVDFARDDREIRAAKRAIRYWLRRFGSGGRRKGDGAIWAGGVPDFLLDLWTTLEKLTQETGVKYGHDPVSAQFRSKMREAPVSANTMRTWLNDADLRPSDIKGGKVTRGELQGICW